MRYSQRKSKASRSERFYDCIDTRVGPLCIVYTERDDETLILKVLFGTKRLDARKRPLGDEIKRQFQEFLDGKRRAFTLRYLAEGTEFERQVWELTSSIPYGETRTYKWIAEKLKKPRGVRAVGQALKKNPLPLIIPCHRVIQSDGNIGGYSSGIDIKRRLLEMEYYNNLSTKH